MSGTMVNMVPHSVGTTTNAESTRHTMSKNPTGRRRTRSKGTIAGFNSPDAPDAPPVTADNSSASLDSSNHAQHVALESPIPTKPSHSANLALLCVQNAVHMGARTQLNLCPPGKARDDIMKALLDRRRRKAKSLPTAPTMRRNLSFSRVGSISSVGSRADETSAFEKVIGEAGLAEYDQAELEYLNNPSLRSLDLNSDGEEMQEDASSGDEDMLDFNFDDNEKYSEGDDGHSVREPLYTLGPDGSANNNQGSATSGKLAFNFRKLKWFDAITASDRAEARKYLKKEISGLKKRDALMLTKHLVKLQRREKRRLEIERGRRNGSHITLSDKVFCEADEDEENSNIGIVKFLGNMTPCLSAALVLESLAFNPLESLEGMSKCYDGIVAAGRALLDSKMDDSESGNKRTKEEIMSALTPLLITTVAQASGETVLALARLQQMCGTKRYQRRFIQRIAPALVRPPDAAIWCLRHQNDMEAIFAATELILDSSSDIFAANWFERGRTLLADSKRAESLKVAAMQLQRLSDPQPNDRIISSLITGSGHRRGGSLSINTPTKDSSVSGSNVNTEVLAEWEILAVDRQIRDSIKHVFNRDWSRIKIRNAPPREGESHPSKKIRGISAGKSKIAPIDIDHNAEIRDSSLLSPPRLTSSKHLLPNATMTSQITPQSPNRSRKSPRRGKGSDHIVSRNSNGVNSSNGQDPPSPPQTPKSQMEMIGSPVRPSPPPPIDTTPPDMKKIISPRQGVPSSPVMSPGPAPLSPSKKPYRRNESTRMANSSPGSSSSAQSTYLRTLTSTANERKRTVAACRALRAQITRFENTFIKVHGRPPKGANERAPLATTYAQYREWKRAIRSDAASRIQAMYRGALVRSILIKDPKFKRIAEKRAGRTVSMNAPPQMPSNMGRDSRKIQPIPPMPLQRRDDPSSTVYDGVEVVMVPENQSVPSWTSRRVSDSKSLDYSASGSGSGSISSVPYSPRADISESSNSSSEINQMSLPELQTQKRELKQLLKKYDMDFHRKHGRMPVKQEKEPIRSLYEQYNTLKQRINAVEKDPSIVSPRSQWKQLQSPNNASQGSFPDYSSNGSMTEQNQSSVYSSSNAPRVPNRSTRRQTESPSNTSIISGGQDLAALKTEKQHLHQMLRAYEKDFFRINNRQVSSYQDIRPVASQYRRYKDIKKSILALQQAQR